MLTILALADNEDNFFWGTLSRFLKPHFAMVDIPGQTIGSGRKKAPLILCGAESFRQIDCDELIVVYKKAVQPGTVLCAAANITAVVDSSADGLLEHVARTKLPAITCGLLTRDTVSLSSIGDSGAVLDIRREIICSGGAVVEAQEIPIALRAPADDFALMAAAAIIILSGKKDALLKGKM